MMESKVQSIDRMFDIIELLSREQDGLGLTEIAARVDLPKSTVFRLLDSVKKRGYVEKTAAQDRYRLGLSFVELCGMYLNSLELKTESLPFLRDLAAATGRTTFLAIRDGLDVVYIDRIERHSDLRKYSIIGQRVPLHCTALGKSLLLGMTEEKIRDLYRNQPMRRKGPRSRSDLESLLAELTSARPRGWTYDDEEAMADVRCAAAPIKDYRGDVIAAVSVSWIIKEAPGMDGKQYAPQVVAAARSISRRMGCAAY